jgi:hypothetical protein
VHTHTYICPRADPKGRKEQGNNFGNNEKKAKRNREWKANKVDMTKRPVQ